eukprot:PhM_4_TR8463/c2_g1_i1/m.47217
MESQPIKNKTTKKTCKKVRAQRPDDCEVKEHEVNSNGDGRYHHNKTKAKAILSEQQQPTTTTEADAEMNTGGVDSAAAKRAKLVASIFGKPKTTTATPPSDTTAAFSGLLDPAAARRLWLSARKDGDFDLVARSLAAFLRQTEAKGGVSSDEEECMYATAQDRLILLLLQLGRTQEACAELKRARMLARLASCVLRYPIEGSEEYWQQMNLSRPPHLPPSSPPLPACVFDSALQPSALARVQSVFGDLSADFWVSHNYSVEPPSPFFSYIVPLADADKLGVLGALAKSVHAAAVTRFPEAADAQYCEMWAHNRPHGTGHQLHFDSDDEGRNGIRNPLCGSIFFVDGSAGGPTVLMEQQLRDKKLAQNGWLIYPRTNRLVVFDGTMLHGVLPGRGVPTSDPSARRATLMLALWKDIRVRREQKHGSARPLPLQQAPPPRWLSDLVDDCDKLIDPRVGTHRGGMIAGEAMRLPHVYETIDGEPWSEYNSLPPYDRVFQGC